MSLGIYIHIPYCLTKCPYCDFNSYGVGSNFPEDEYTSAVIREIDFYSDMIYNEKVSSIFFGGGTPSLFKPENIKKILDHLGKFGEISENVEISIEINPKTANSDKINHFREIGINRASVGIQSFSDRKLKFYGRLNSAKEGIEVLQDINDAKFKNFNLDLIYGSADENLKELETDLRTSLQFNTTHISAYCLTIEDGTQFGSLYKQGMLKLPEDSLLSEMYRLTTDVLSANDYEHYEISNFCRPGYECTHNMIYWECDSYLGLGAGAHSHLKESADAPWGKRWANIKNPKSYMDTINSGPGKYQFTEHLSREEALQDRLLMGLRLKKGVDIKQLEESFGAEFNKNSLLRYRDNGLVEFSGGILKITDSGRIYANELILSSADSFNLIN